MYITSRDVIFSTLELRNRNLLRKYFLHSNLVNLTIKLLLKDPFAKKFILNNFLSVYA